MLVKISSFMKCCHSSLRHVTRRDYARKELARACQQSIQGEQLLIPRTTIKFILCIFGDLHLYVQGEGQLSCFLSCKYLFWLEKCLYHLEKAVYLEFDNFAPFRQHGGLQFRSKIYE